MKQFKGFVKKEFLHIIRDVRSMMILFGIPVIQILLFGYVLTNEVRDANISVLDNSSDHVSQQLVSRLSASGYFRVSSHLDSPLHIEQELKSGRARLVVVIDPGMAQAIAGQQATSIQIIADASDPNTANMLVSYINAIITGFAQELMPAPANAVHVDQHYLMLYNEELKGAFMFVPGTMALILMLLSAMMTSISIAREKEMGTMEVLLVSPLRPMQIILGKVTPYIAMAFLNAVVIITLGILVFEMPILGSLTLLMAQSLLFICMALALGILISTMAPSQQVAMFISMFALMLPTILLSGFIFPIANMPWWLQEFSRIIPARYFIVIIRNIMLKGAGFEFVWKETLVLAIMLVAFIIISIRKFKIRLE